MIISFCKHFDLSASLHRACRTACKCVSLAAGNYANALGDSVNEELAGRVRAEQVRSILRHMSSAMIASLVNGAVLVATLWNAAPTPLVVGWGLVLATAIALVVASRMASRRRSRLTRVSSGVIAKINRNALLLGAIWAAAPIMFFADASEGARIVIACVCAGMMGGAAFTYASTPSAAIAMIMPIAASSIWTLARAGGDEFVYVIMLVICFCVVLIHGIMLHALDLMRRFVTRTEIQQVARRDGLTNLDNRATFRGLVTEAMLRLERAQEPCAIFLIDLDDLKRVNEQYGHSVGDDVLIETAMRLQKVARRVDRIARLDGDQFAIIAANLAGEMTIRAYAARIVQAFVPAYESHRAKLNVSACVGAFVAQQSGINVESVMRNAELALQMAQSRGANSFHVFGPKDDAALLERNALGRDLGFALERGELSLAFQPMFRLSTQSVVGFEALLRWHHPLHGAVSPTVFIPIAESTGLIEAIGAWVIHEACAAASAWPAGMRVCVNVSAYQLRSRALCVQVAAALDDANLTPDQLEIEITESVLVADDALPREILTSLRQTGVRLALDDFGTGYSSLSYLRRLPFDRIKIDRSFITEISSDRDSAAIVKSVIALAQDLGMDVIAEGIETAEQLECLRAMNCPEVQGFYIAKPMPESDVQRYLAGGVVMAAA